MYRVYGKIFIYIAVFLLFITSGVFSAVYPNQSVSAQEYYINVTSVTKLDKDGNRVAYEAEIYSRGVQINVELNSPSLKVLIYEKTGGSQEFLQDSYYKSVTGGRAVIDISLEGSLRVVLIAEETNGTELKRTEKKILSDNTPPPKPELDTTQLEIYRKSPFNLAYTLVSDTLSGIDPAVSQYTFTGTGGVIKIQNNFEPLTNSERFIPGIDANGVIKFELFDKAGNKAEYSYNYTRYGIPESEPPTVILTPGNGYAKKVTVEISWGEGYDSHPFAVKEYSLVTAAGTQRKAYVSPFDVQSEGSATLTVYYYREGAEKSKSFALPYIDKTPPGIEAISSSFAVYCDLTATQMPLYASVRALDAASGIKEVRFSSGEVFINYDENLYKGDITDKHSFTIIAEDNAGNIREYSVLNLDYDYEGIAFYAEMFASLNQEDFTAWGWEQTLAAFRELSMDFISETSFSDLAASKRRASEAGEMGIIFITRINNIPEGLSGAMNFDFSPETLSLKKGDRAIIYIDKASGQAGEVKEREANALAISAMRHAYSFNLSALNADNSPIVISGGGRIEITLPTGTKDAKIYYYGNNGLTPLSAEFADGKIALTVYSLGDFYIVSEQEEQADGLVIGGKFYSAELLIIAAAIVLGGSVAAGLTVVIISKFRKKR